MKTVLRGADLNCPSCAVKLERALTALPGVERARVHFATGRIEVERDDARVAVEDLLKVVRQLGYNVKVAGV